MIKLNIMSARGRLDKHRAAATAFCASPKLPQSSRCLKADVCNRFKYEQPERRSIKTPRSENPVSSDFYISRGSVVALIRQKQQKRGFLGPSEAVGALCERRFIVLILTFIMFSLAAYKGVLYLRSFL